MTTQNSSRVQATQDDLLQEWHQQAWLTRLFLPGDFLTSVSVVESENLVCQKATLEFLDMEDKVEVKTMKGSEAGKYSTNVDYRPQEFKNETLRLITNEMGVNCGDCSGNGQTICGKCSGDGEITCDRCKGRGQVACDTTKDCESCRGSGTRSEKCGNCGGGGGVYGGTDKDGNAHGRPCPSCGGSGRRDSDCGKCNGGQVRCDRCGGRGNVGCGRCDKTGILRCDRCSGSGVVVCKRCAGSGRLVQAEIITRKFSHITERSYQLTGLAPDEFKNGLESKHFKSMTGSPVSEEFETPTISGAVLQRLSVHSYDVLSRRYSYQDAEFCLNKISSSSDSKYAASDLPLSMGKIWAAIAGGAALSVVIAVGVALSIML